MADPQNQNSATYVHLKVHSAYSLLEGALPVGTLAKLAVGYGFPAIAITDTNNLFGALDFSNKLWDAGVQPIVGCSIDVDFADHRESRDMRLMRPCLLYTSPSPRDRTRSRMPSSA